MSEDRTWKSNVFNSLKRAFEMLEVHAEEDNEGDENGLNAVPDAQPASKYHFKLRSGEVCLGNTGVFVPAGLKLFPTFLRPRLKFVLENR